MSEYKYAIKKIKKRNGVVVHIPMARLESKIRLININEWMRIMKFYDTFELMKDFLDKDFGLSMDDCVAHIEGFKKQQEEMNGLQTETIEMIFTDDQQGDLLKLA